MIRAIACNKRWQAEADPRLDHCRGLIPRLFSLGTSKTWPAMGARACHKRRWECFICPCHFSVHIHGARLGVLYQCTCCIAASIDFVSHACWTAQHKLWLPIAWPIVYTFIFCGQRLLSHSDDAHMHTTTPRPAHTPTQACPTMSCICLVLRFVIVWPYTWISCFPGRKLICKATHTMLLVSCSTSAHLMTIASQCTQVDTGQWWGILGGYNNVFPLYIVFVYL